MPTAALAITVAVSLLVGGCTVFLVRLRKGRLAAALSLTQPRSIAEPAPVLRFPAAWTEVVATGHELARVSGLTLMEAEDLLDWLEQNGYGERALVCESEKSFAVEFRVDAAHAHDHRPHQGQVRRFSAG